MGDILLQTPYSTAMPYIVKGTSGGWTDEYDRQRLLSYDLYDDMYHNEPGRYQLMLRGSDEKPIFVPTAGSIIRSLARYVGRNWGFLSKLLSPTSRMRRHQRSRRSRSPRRRFSSASCSLVSVS